VEKGASQAKALHRSGRERTHLAVESFFEMELLYEKIDALRGGGFRKMIKATEEAQIFAASKPGVEADVAAGVIAELAANGARLEHGIVPGDLRAAAGGEKQRGENAEERGFARAVCAEQCQRFARTHFEGKPGESNDAGLFEWLEQGTQAGAGGRKKLLESCNTYRGFRHDETYSVSAARRQSSRDERQMAPNRRELFSLDSEWRDSPVECRRAISGRTKETE